MSPQPETAAASLAARVVLACESKEEFDALRDAFIAEYRPAGPTERFLLDLMVVNRWRLKRIWRIESALYDAEFRRQQADLTQADPHSATLAVLAFRALSSNSRGQDPIKRHERHLKRGFNQASRTLAVLQDAASAAMPGAHQKMSQEPSPTNGHSGPFQADGLPSPL